MENNRLRVEEWDALEFQQCMVQRMSSEITDPLSYHDRHHDRQQELDVISDLHLRGKAFHNFSTFETCSVKGKDFTILLQLFKHFM